MWVGGAVVGAWMVVLSLPAGKTYVSCSFFWCPAGDFVLSTGGAAKKKLIWVVPRAKR